MVEDAEGVAAEGGVGLAMLGWGLLLALAVLGFLSGSWGLKVVAVSVEVPHWRR